MRVGDRLRKAAVLIELIVVGARPALEVRHLEGAVQKGSVGSGKGKSYEEGIPDR